MTVMLGRTARTLIAWIERHADAADQEWVRALRAELDVIEGGLAQLRWAIGALVVLWRPYRMDFLRLMVCTAAVVVANYAYPRFATARPVELFFFAQQFYLPVLGILAGYSTRRVLAGTAHGIGASLLGLAVVHALGYGTPDSAAMIGTGGASIYVQVLFFAIVGAALGTAGALTVRFPGKGAIQGSTSPAPAAPDQQS